MAFPDLTQFWMLVYGGYGYDTSALPAGFNATAAGLVFGTNPPYAVSDFLAFYPKFTNLVPAPVLNAYIALATASLMQARWREGWAIAMGLYVAHLATLYLKTEGDQVAAGANDNVTAQTAVSAAQRGLGVLVSKSAGGVSAGYQTIKGVDDWGSFALTSYGTDLATKARVVGMGPVWVG